MIAYLQTLIAALREELHEYGEMLARLDEQQELVMKREADGILQSVSTIQDQSVVIQRVREIREKRQGELAANLGLESNSEFSQILPRIPEDYHGLLQALVHENNALLTRIQHRARQNHLLLRQSLDLMQRFLSTLFPSQEPRVYNGGGQMFPNSKPAISVYEAVG
jgi:flagellar biosynthesis/type III secretory pathway chaperone